MINGHLKLQMYQNGDYYGIQCDVRVDDGQLHTLTLEITSKSVSFILDQNEPIIQTLDQNWIWASEHFFIGGKIEEFVLGKIGFRGCIYQVLMDTKEIDFADDSISTGNIVPCLE